jgi:hypothetical protein
MDKVRRRHPRVNRAVLPQKHQNRCNFGIRTLVKGRHKTDSDQYRGLGYRTDAKERGRFVELFFLQAEDGSGITKGNINVGIMKYHAKQAQLEVEKEKAKIARANG